MIGNAEYREKEKNGNWEQIAAQMMTDVYK